MKALTGKNIWIVGASSGIGEALAKRLLAAGNFLYLSARNTQALKNIQARHSSHVEVLEGDVTDPDQLSLIRSRLTEKTDLLDMVIFCAGTCEYDDGPNLELPLYRRVFELNYFAAIACIELALPFLKKAKGRIVGISSLAAVVPFPRAEAYGGSKVAFEYLLQSLSLDLAASSVSVSIVRPGFVETPLTRKNDFDMPYMVSADFAAKKIVHGLTREKSIIDFPFQLSLVLNVFSHFKWLWIRLIAKRFRKVHEL